MKCFNILLVFLLVSASCRDSKEDGKAQAPITTVHYAPVGDTIPAENALSAEGMWEKYRLMQVSDTVNAKFTASVADVCKAKGCWMKVTLADGQRAMVKFKDYGFFMPQDIVGKKVVINGVAFVEEMSVEDQRHYAADGGADEKELSMITTPKKTYGFEANGVLIPQ
jgi:hypothetical protein